MYGTRNVYIAVIDDDESLCRSMSRLLRASNLQAITYPSVRDYVTDVMEDYRFYKARGHL